MKLEVVRCDLCGKIRRKEDIGDLLDKQVCRICLEVPIIK